MTKFTYEELEQLYQLTVPGSDLEHKIDTMLQDSWEHGTTICPMYVRIWIRIKDFGEPDFIATRHELVTSYSGKEGGFAVVQFTKADGTLITLKAGSFEWRRL